MQNSLLDLREVIVFLFAAGIVVPLMGRLRISPVFGFLAVGLLIGPYGLSRFSEAMPWLAYLSIADAEGVRLLAEMGVVFLLFMIGLELSLDRLWAMRSAVFGLGGAQIVLSTMAIAGVAWLFGNPMSVSIILGASFALSSTAIVMQMLTENRRLGTPTGRAGFAILLCQDIAVLPILFLLGVFAAQSELPVFLAFSLAIGEAVLAVAAILLLGRVAIRPVFRFLDATASREMFLALVLLVIIGTALATEHFGLSLALGAFLAGLLLAETEYRHQIRGDVEPFKGLLLGLFFVSIGMGIDITQVAQNPGLLLASVVGLFVLKGVIIYALVRRFGEPPAVALETGLLLGQAGEFAFIVVGMAYTIGLVPNDTAQFMLIVAGLAMIATPAVANLARRWALRIEEKADAAAPPDAPFGPDLNNHVIIIGYGRAGQLLGGLLADQNIAHVGLDTNRALVRGFQQDGASVYLGDGNRPELLRQFGIDEAAALVVTMNNTAATEAVVVNTRRIWKDLPIFVRAHDQAQAKKLILQGANHAIPETVEASLQMGEMVLAALGIPPQTATNIVECWRRVEQEKIDSGT